MQIADFVVGPGQPLCLIAGPCVIEGLDSCQRVAERLADLRERLALNVVFKSSFDKANRTSPTSYRGPGLEEGLKILAQISSQFGLPVVTDLHQPDQVEKVAEVCDLLQIPAFLCRQTDLLLAAGRSGKPVFVKKGQFLSPWEMEQVVQKIASTGNRKILLGDRGTSFGYQTLVSDFRSIPIMRGLGYPVCFDATHSVQQPGRLGSRSGGEREFVPLLAKAAIVSGADALFLETHPDPETALCDAATQWPLERLEEIVQQLVELHAWEQKWAMSRSSV